PIFFVPEIDRQEPGGSDEEDGSAQIEGPGHAARLYLLNGPELVLRLGGAEGAGRE
ncbi:MAG: hypothetical protein Q9167_007765, partial [Letrouitia subvulpina]